MAAAGLVLSIAGLVLGFLSGVFSIIGLPVSIIGLALAVKAGKNARAQGLPTGVATAGMVVGIIAVVISAITFFTCGICILCASGVAAGADSLFS